MIAVLIPLACSGAPTLRPADGVASRTAFELVHSPPAQWAPAFAAVLAHGPTAIGPLVEALDAAPHAPGAQPAVAALGRLGLPGHSADAVTAHAVSALLIRLLGHPSPDLAAEAALSLARVRAVAARPELRASMLDPARPTYVRTAAATALLDLEEHADAIAFLCDVILATSDRGRTDALTRGLPVDQVRWAVERNLAIDAIRRAAGGRDFGLDADASWPRLAASVAAARAHFELASR